MRDFYKVAIMLIYPDGYMDEIYVDKEVLHSYYYRELAKKSHRFSEIVKLRNINVDDYFYTTNLSIVNIENIIVIDNIDIFDIVHTEDYLKNNVPEFLFNLPSKLTHEQKEVLKSLFENYYLCNAAYGNPKEDKLDPINYYELLNSLYETTKKV